jgi:uncharacterized protein (DUF1501 family)
MDFAPFVVRNTEKPPENLSPAASVGRARLEQRWQLLQSMDAAFALQQTQEIVEEKQAIYHKARELMNSPDLKAFDLQQEPEKTRRLYGDTAIGRGCLLARRLVEAGVKFVEVEMDGWDTHRDNFATVRTLLGQLDPAYSSLLRDLRDRALLESTLVLWMGEFGRTPAINANAGRDHWPNNWCALVAGGGVQGGQVIGATNARGDEIVESPVTVPDLYATTCRLLGIDDSTYNSSPLGRPIRVVDKGKPVAALL